MISYLIKHLQFVCLLMLLAVFSKISAQEDCSFTLSKAQKLYDAGQIEQIPQMLQSCIENGFSSDEKLQAQKLIVLSYLFDNNTKEADKAMLAFLKKYPEYEILPADQAEFIQLFNTYRTVPIASIGAVIGTNYNLIRPTNLYGTNGNKGSYSNSGFSYQAGISYKQYIKTKFDLNLSILYCSNTYQYSNSIIAGPSSITFTETQNNIEFPLSLIYTPYTFGRFSPFVRAGINTGYLLSSSGTGVRSTTLLGKDVTGSSLDLTKKREALQFWGLLGSGVCVNFKGIFVMFDLRYSLNLTNQVKKSGRQQTNDDQIWLYYNNENDYNWNKLTFTIGLFYKFYKPQKR